MLRSLTAAVGILILLLVVAITAALFYRGNAIDAEAGAANAQNIVIGLEAQLKSERDARSTEHSQAQDMAQIGDEHETERETSASIPAAVVAGLRTGNLQLRDDLATCHTARLSQAVSGAIERDASAQLRPEVAGAALQIVTEAEDHVRSCQRSIGVLTGQRPAVEVTP